MSEQRTEVSAQGFQERFEGLIASTRELLPGRPTHESLMVCCDGCGRLEDVERPELPAGWVTNEHGEFCPECQR